jgi:hypothetical protein
MALSPSLSPRALAACAAALVLPAIADAAETRYVASNGTANETCSRSMPCNTLQRAVNRTSAGGEVIVLDSGSYGNSLTVNRSITISADGVTATLIDPGGITINRADAVVTLRGLHLKGAGAGGVSGILVQNAASVHIEGCTIESFRSRGIHFTRDDAQLFVTDSIVRNNGLSGLEVDASNVTVAIDNSRFENNSSNGVMFVGNTQATITRSVSSGNGSNGITQNTGRINVTSTTAAHNGTNGYLTISGGEMTLESAVGRGNGASGLRVADGSSRARVSRSVFTDNVIGVSNNNGNVQTLQNNILLGNGTNLQNSGTITTPAPF